MDSQDSQNQDQSYGSQEDETYDEDFMNLEVLNRLKFQQVSEKK